MRLTRRSSIQLAILGIALWSNACATGGARRDRALRGSRVPDCNGAVAVITNMADRPIDVWLWPQQTNIARVVPGTSYVSVGAARGSWLVLRAPGYHARHASSRSPANVRWQCP
jgi:hypothetical protein